MNQFYCVVIALVNVLVINYENDKQVYDDECAK